MTQNNLINQIVEVLKKHAGEKNIHALQLKYGNKFEQMIAEIAALKPQENDGWISVEDAKLENETMYYICWAGSVFDPLEWEEDSQSFTDDYRRFHKSEITHVMPYTLPSPPKSK